MRTLALVTSGLILAACSQTAANNKGPANTAIENPVVENAAGASKIISESAATIDAAEWGDFHAYFNNDTHVLKPVLVGVAKIKAGEQIHPPHRHADEEYLMVTAGRGTWSLNGVESLAEKGDILFARAWDYHGVKAADDSALEFVVFKYSGNGVSAPTDPNPSLPEEQLQ